MGNSPASHSERARRVSDGQLSRPTAFSPKELRTLHMIFQQGCELAPSRVKRRASVKRQKRHTDAMNRSQFQWAFHDLLPEAESVRFADFAFDVYDLDNDGFVSFLDFVSTLEVYLRGSYEQKVQLLFALYDIDSDGCVMREEVQEIIEMLTELNINCVPVESVVTPANLAKAIFKSLALADSEVITRAEFLQAAMSNMTFRYLLEGTANAICQPYIKTVGALAQLKLESKRRRKSLPMF